MSSFAKSRMRSWWFLKGYAIGCTCSQQSDAWLILCHTLAVRVVIHVLYNISWVKASYCLEGGETSIFYLPSQFLWLVQGTALRATCRSILMSVQFIIRSKELINGIQNKRKQKSKGTSEEQSKCMVFHYFLSVIGTSSVLKMSDSKYAGSTDTSFVESRRSGESTGILL